MNLSAAVYTQLEAAAQRGIQSAFSGLGQLPKPTTEPEFVAAFVLGAAPQIAKDWTQILSSLGVRLSLSAVYCHQSPMVTFDPVGSAWPLPVTPKPAKCELADLLIVHDEHQRGSLVRRQAVLIQTKKTSSVVVTNPDPTQYHLYRDVPTFEIVPKNFERGARRFGAYPPNFKAWRGLQYGLISTANPSAATWHMSWPKPKMTCDPHRQLHHFLTQMLVPAWAVGRRADPNLNSHWSATIEELLDITAMRLFRLKSFLGNSRAPAGSLQLGVLKADGTYYASLGQSGKRQELEIPNHGSPTKLSLDDAQMRDLLIREALAGSDGRGSGPPDTIRDEPGPGVGVSTVYFETDRDD